MNKVTILTEPIPQFNYDGESDRDFYTKKANWYSSHLKEIGIDEMADKIAERICYKLTIDKVSLTVDIGNAIYAFLKQ